MTPTCDFYWEYCHIQPIKVSLYTYPLIFMHDRTPRTLSLLLTYLTITAQIRLLLKQSLQLNLHPWVISSPGRDPWSPHLACPPEVFIFHLDLNWPYPLIRGTKVEWVTMNSFPKAPTSGGRPFNHSGDAPQHLSITESVSCCLYNPFGALLPCWPQGLGDAEMFCSDVTFLLVLTEEGAVGDRVYSLAMIWVNPYQARVTTVEEKVKQLTALVSTRPDWPYGIVRLNGDACTMHHCLERGTWASWWEEAPAMPPAEGSVN